MDTVLDKDCGVDLYKDLDEGLDGDLDRDG